MDERMKAKAAADPAWPDLWQQELAAIRRTRRTTYIIAGLVAVIAVLIVLLPILIR